MPFIDTESLIRELMHKKAEQKAELEAEKKARFAESSELRRMEESIQRLEEQLDWVEEVREELRDPSDPDVELFLSSEPPVTKVLPDGTLPQAEDDYATKASSPEWEDRPFCTQRCLLGLKNGKVLDRNCPNLALHPRFKNIPYHRFDCQRLVERIRKSLDLCQMPIMPIDRFGSHAVAFKVTDMEYGYTFIGKGCTCASWSDVVGEVDIYRRLEPIQGSAVPVCLGSIDLDLSYISHGPRILKHMILMSWGGEALERYGLENDIIQETLYQTLREIDDLGVVHNDVHAGNVLWNEELNRTMIIDFNLSFPRSRGYWKDVDEDWGLTNRWCPHHGSLA